MLDWGRLKSNIISLDTFKIEFLLIIVLTFLYDQMLLLPLYKPVLATLKT